MFLVFCILYILGFYPEVFLTLCTFKSPSLTLRFTRTRRQTDATVARPSWPLSIHHVLYDRSPTSSSSGSPLPLWHSVKRGPAKAQTPARPPVWLLSSLSWPDNTGPPLPSSLPSPPPGLLHPALTLQLPVAILGDKTASGHL